jgi:hypothetical protein
MRPTDCEHQTGSDFSIRLQHQTSASLVSTTETCSDILHFLRGSSIVIVGMSVFLFNPLAATPLFSHVLAP